jgi:hypothetical protein
LVFFIASTAIAQSGSIQTPHQHGHGLLQIAIEGNTLDILFHAPAASLTGFEHAPQSDEQAELVRSTRTWLEQTPLATFSGRQCEVTTASIINSQPHHEPETDSHGDEGHQHSRGETHSEYEVSQSIRCDGQQSQLRSPLPERFHRLETLQVEWVSPDGQGSDVMGQDRSEITISPE